MIFLLMLSVFPWQVDCRAKRQVDDGFQNEIPGEANVDYPTLGSVPDTSFTCSGRVSGGYYADTETDCQVFHICGGSNSIFGSIKYSFVCPNGTMFHQQYFICDWWYNVDCQASQDYYGLNNNIGIEGPASPGNSDKNSNNRPNNFQSGGSAQDSLPGYKKQDSQKKRPMKNQGRQMGGRKQGRGAGKKSPVRVEITSPDSEVFRFPNFSRRQKRKNNLEILTGQEKFLLVDDREPRDYDDFYQDFPHNPIFD